MIPIDIKTNMARELELRVLESEVAEYRRRPPHLTEVMRVIHGIHIVVSRPRITFAPWRIQ